jgi:MFS transporter, Spinster family, sphingosine-1-phosphate transporter
MSENGTAVAAPARPAERQAPLPGARAALALMILINLFNYIDRQVLAAVEKPIEETIFPVGPDGLRDPYAGTKMGALMTAFMVSYMVCSPVFGWLADRMSRWVLVGVGVLVWTAASGGSGLAQTFAVLFATRCFVGVGEAAYGPAAPALISDLYPVKVRGYVMSWFYAAIPVGSALGYVLGAAALKLPVAESWRWAFYLVVPPGVLLGLWCFLMREPPRGQADAGAEGTRKARWQDYLVLFRTPSYVLCTLGMTAMTFALGGIAFWMPRYISDVRQAGELAHVNLLFGGIVVVSGLSATLLGGWAGDKLKPRFPGSYFLVSGTAMLVGFPLVLAVLYVPFPLAWVFVFLACFALFFNTGPTNTVLANVTHPAVRASAFALNILVIHALGDAISPMVIGAIKDHTGRLEVGFMVVSGLIFCAGLIWLAGARYLARDTDLAPTRLAPERPA